MSELEIIWTKVDEAPALATYSLLPIVQSFVGVAGVKMTLKDISLTGRILANFPDKLKPEQKVNDELAELGKLALKPEANIIKLPNISASVPQLKAAIKELQGKGYDVPDYPDNPANDAEREIRARYGKVLGSAVNPVLREGNSDRRAAGAVKQYARNNPHKMGAWSKDSKSHVAYMPGGDFYGSEVATTMTAPTNARIELVAKDGSVAVLKAKTPLIAGEIIDCSVMSRKALRAFLAEQIDAAKREGVLFSVHLKATMMKISDPILFGHAVSVFFADVFQTHGATLTRLGVNPNNGVGDMLAKIETLPEAEKAAILADIDHGFATKRPPIDTGYFETYNRDNVALVNLRAEPIERITATGVKTSKGEYPLDIIVFATGFDAMTGPLFNLNIAGRNGLALRDVWREGPRYLGLQVVGFPNLFTVTGPGSPSVLTNMPVAIEQHVDWISRCIADMRAAGQTRIEAKPDAVDDWMVQVQEVASRTLFTKTLHSW